MSTEIENSPMFLALEDKYKQSIMDDTTLSRAAKMGAKHEILLNCNKSAAWKMPRVKVNSRLLRHWTAKARSMNPGGAVAGGTPDDVDETPMKKMVDRLIKQATPQQPPPGGGRGGTKRKLPFTPPSTSRIPRFSPAKTLPRIPAPSPPATPKPSPVQTRSKTKAGGKQPQSLKGSIAKGAKQGAAKAAAKTFEKWLDF